MKFIFDWDNKKKSAIVQSDYLDVLREGLSVEDKQTSFAMYRRNRKWQNMRKYAIKPSGYFNIGIFPDIYDFLKTIETPYNCIITQKFKDKFKPSIISNELEYEILPLDLPARFYQEECVLKCLKQGNGINVVATAGGKTLIMALLLRNIHSIKNDTKTLIITIPQLVTQTYKDFLSYGLNKYLDISRWDGKNKYSDTDVIIASNTILLSKKQDLTPLKTVSTLICDEIHKLRSGNKINKIIKKIKAEHTYGFTGTLPENKYDIWNITGQFGPIVYTKSSDELRKDNFISNAKIIALKLKYLNPPKITKTPSIDDPLGAYHEELDFLYKSDFRNNSIGKICDNINKNTLVLVDRLEHQQLLIDSIKRISLNKNVKCIKGDVPGEDREQIKLLMEKTDNVICVAMSSIFATGINIKNIHYIIFAMAGKAKVRILQSIGRGLRLHENKHELIIIDIVDCLYYGLQHYEQRLQLYEEEKITYDEKYIKEKEGA